MFQCLVSPDKKLAYLMIYKNASTFVNSVLTKHLWTEHNVNYIPSSMHIIIILREDIIMRWVSGLTTYITLQAQRNNNLDSVTLDHKLLIDVFDSIEFDIHTYKQSTFVQALKHFNNIKFLKLQPNFNTILQQLLNEYGFYNYKIPLYAVNSTRHKSYDEKRTYNFIKEHSLMPAYNNKLVNFFQKDYELIENTTFYNS